MLALALPAISVELLAQTSPASQPARRLVAIVVGAQECLRTAGNELAEELTRSQIPWVKIDLPKDRREGTGTDEIGHRLAAAGPAVIATCGTDATQVALDATSTTPIVFVMVPNVADAPFAGTDKSANPRLAGIPADVAPREQIEWIKSAIPTTLRLAVLYSARTTKSIELLRNAATALNVTLVPIATVANEFTHALDALTTQRCQGVLMIPDAAVYNSVNVEQLLLWGIRTRTPIWTFSLNLAKAGAYGGQQVDAGAAGRQAAQLIARIRGGTSPAQIGIQPAQWLQRGINDRTAGLIGVTPQAAANMGNVEHFGAKP